MKKYKEFFQHKRNWVGLILVGTMAVIALITPAVAPRADPAQPDSFLRVGRATDSKPRPPSETALLGTLSGQFDVLYTLLWGLRQAFVFGLSVTFVAALFGILYGATSAYLGGVSNNLMMRVADAFLTFPMLAALVFMRQIIVLLLEKSGILLNFLFTIPVQFNPLQQFLMNADPVLWSLILFSWMPYARLVNASVLRLRNAEFILSARGLGAGHPRIILRHLLPNVLSPEIVLAARDVGGMVILQATFTFIGLGGDSPWGRILSIARDWIVGPGGNPFVYWWTYIPTTLALILFAVGWNFMGDSLNEWFTPRRTS